MLKNNYLKSILILALAVTTSCEKEPADQSPSGDTYFDGAYECQKNSTNRIGATCNDGTKSKSTGSGTCSSHGGVKVWLCK